MGRDKNRAGAAELVSKFDLLARWYRTSLFRSFLTLFNGLYSMACIILYVYDTYSSLSDATRICYLIASLTFFVEYVLELSVARSRIAYIFWSSAIIDLLTIVYGFVNFFTPSAFSTSVAFVRVLRMVPVVKFAKSLSEVLVLYLRVNMQPMEVQMFTALFDLFVTLVGTIFIGGAVFYEIERTSWVRAWGGRHHVYGGAMCMRAWRGGIYFSIIC